MGMLDRARVFLKAELEAYLEGGRQDIDPELRLARRRGRGFALITAATTLFTGCTLSLVMRIPEFAFVSACAMAFWMGAVRLAAIQGGRFIGATTHTALAVGFCLVFVASVELDFASPIGVTFSSLIILSASYLLGVRAALLWTAISIAGVSYAVLTSRPIPFPPDARQPSLELILASRIVVLLGTCAIAAAERHFSDRQRQELMDLASRDALTGLLNRRAFRDRLSDSIARARRHGRRVGLVFLDLDGFKAVNDDQGHAVGDEVLRLVAERIGAITRQGDFAGRVGGDEFVLLLEDVGESQQMEALAEKVLAQIETFDPTRLPPGAEIGFSVGVACFPEDADDVESLMAAADAAMYDAKAHGGGVAVHGPSRSG